MYNRFPYIFNMFCECMYSDVLFISYELQWTLYHINFNITKIRFSVSTFSYFFFSQHSCAPYNSNRYKALILEKRSSSFLIKCMVQFKRKSMF